MRSTANSGCSLPFPRPMFRFPDRSAFCNDTSVLGTEFYLMERLEGRVFHDAALPDLAPAEREAIYLSMGETLARLHAVSSGRRRTW